MRNWNVCVADKLGGVAEAVARKCVNILKAFEDTRTGKPVGAAKFTDTGCLFPNAVTAAAESFARIRVRVGETARRELVV